tara:strand:+ start:1716 stop:2162 length:447 start_codon:yes stop_codon:yes gene_type:complete
MEKQIDYTKLNPRKLRRAKREVVHTFAVNELERLCSWLSDDSGQLEVRCQFNFPYEESIEMTMILSGQLKPLCQRCLEFFDYDWSSKTTLLLDEEDSLPEGMSDECYEHISMTHDGTFNLVEVIIDEVILGLPKTHQTECEHDLGLEF